MKKIFKIFIVLLFISPLLVSGQTILTVETDATWRVYPLPLGVASTQPTSGWESDLIYDDVTAPWQSATINRPATMVGDQAACSGPATLMSGLTPMIWYSSSTIHPRYDHGILRKKFTLDCISLGLIDDNETFIDGLADDYGEVYLNGHVVGSFNITSGRIPASDFKAYLLPGENVLAVYNYDDDQGGDAKCVGVAMRLQVAYFCCTTNELGSFEKISIGNSCATCANENMVISKGILIDRESGNNGTITNTLKFGNCTTSEAIGSKRTAGGNNQGLDFYTNSTNRMAITNSGYVGIGTTNPQDNLHVIGGIRLERTAVQPNALDISVTSNAFLSPTLGNGTTNFKNMPGAGMNPDMSFSANGTAHQLTIKNNGNIGVNTTVPEQKMHVYEGSVMISNHQVGNDGILFKDIDFTGSRVADWGIQYNSNGLNFWRPYGCRNDGTANNLLFLHDNGNVGIGTNTPNPHYGVNAKALIIQNQNTMGRSMIELWSDNLTNTTNKGIIQQVGANTYIGNLGAANNTFAAGKNLYLTVGNGATAVSVLGSNGNVGIYSTNPLAMLHVGDRNGATLGGTTVRFEDLAQNAAATRVIVSDASGNLGWKTVPATIGSTSLTCSTSNMVPKITAANTLGCGIIFDNGTSVGVSSTGPFNYTLFSPPSGVGPVPLVGTVKLDVNGTIRSTSYFAFSDGTYKTAVEPLHNAMSILSQLNGKTYLWTSEAQQKLGADNGLHIGYIAQELQKVIPEIVIKDEAGKMAVNYTEIIPIITEAIKEQQAEIAAKDLEIKEIKNQLAELKSLITDVCNGKCEAYNALHSGSVDLSQTTKIVLDQNVPNPFSEKTMVNYSIEREFSHAVIKFTDLYGKVIYSYPITKIGKGEVEVYGANLTSGIYSYSLIVDGQVIESKKMVKE